MKLNQNQVDALQEACDNEDVSLRLDYSGRGMYGKQCIGIVADGSGVLMKIAMELLDSDDDDVQDMYRIMADYGPVEDSMGRSVIYYWPNVGVEEA